MEPKVYTFLNFLFAILSVCNAAVDATAGQEGNCWSSAVAVSFFLSLSLISVIFGTSGTIYRIVLV